MSAQQKYTLRPLTAEERTSLERIVRATSERADRQRRATALLAVADGATLVAAARRAGWTTGDSVSALIRRFHAHGLTALDVAPGRGPKPHYDAAARAAVATLVATPPDRERDQTATWSLTLLERAARQQPTLQHLGRSTIRRILQASGASYQRTRTWCPTGTARRVRKSGVVIVTDPAAEKKNDDRPDLSNSGSQRDSGLVSG